MNEPGDKIHYFDISMGSFVELENDDKENELVLQDVDLKQANSDHTPLHAPLSNSHSSNLSLRRSKRQHKINEFYTRDYVPSEGIGYYGQIYATKFEPTKASSTLATMQESLQSRTTVPIKNKVDLSQLPVDYEPIDCYKCCSKMKFNIREMQAKSGKVLKIPILRCSNLQCNAYKAVKKIISNGTLKKKQKIGTNENLQPSILIQKSVKFSEMIQSEDGPKEDVDEGYFDQSSSSYLSPTDNSKSEELFSEKNGIAVVLVEDIDVEKMIKV